MALVDTDVMIDVLRGYQPALEWLKSRSGETLVMPGFVLMELLEGCKDKPAQERVLEIARNCSVIWLSESAFKSAVNLFVSYRLSHGLDMMDVLVAQTAIQLDVPLLSFNQKHYRCIPNLAVSAPYSRTV